MPIPIYGMENDLKSNCWAQGTYRCVTKAVCVMTCVEFMVVCVVNRIFVCMQPLPGDGTASIRSKFSASAGMDKSNLQIIFFLLFKKNNIFTNFLDLYIFYTAFAHNLFKIFAGISLISLILSLFFSIVFHIFSNIFSLKFLRT